MRRVNIVVLTLSLGCASRPSASANSPAEASVAEATEPPPAAQPRRARKGQDATPTASAAVPAPKRSKKARQPAFEPLDLDNKQMTRARRVQPIVARVSHEYGVDANLINGIIWAESKFNPKARNRSGARGLMQLMPKTSKAMAKRIGRPNRPYDPDFAVTAGTHLLSGLLEKFDGDEELALFGYARGGGSVRKWQSSGKSELPEGVQKFIARVRRAQATFDGLGFPT
jgi:hypothetical protein